MALINQYLALDYKYSNFLILLRKNSLFEKLSKFHPMAKVLDVLDTQSWRIQKADKICSFLSPNELFFRIFLLPWN
jgi:hypothetical protein